VWTYAKNEPAYFDITVSLTVEQTTSVTSAFEVYLQHCPLGVSCANIPGARARTSYTTSSARIFTVHAIQQLVNTDTLQILLDSSHASMAVDITDGQVIFKTV